jgi:23S rRNA (guanosine2251-2'-O)-methyltransferase
VPRWSDIPEHKSKSRGPDRGPSQGYARGSAQSPGREPSQGPGRGPSQGPARGSAQSPAGGPARGSARGSAGGSDRRETSFRRGEAGAPRKSNYSSAGRGDRPVSRKEDYSGSGNRPEYSSAGRGDRPVSRREDYSKPFEKRELAAAGKREFSRPDRREASARPSEPREGREASARFTPAPAYEKPVRRHQQDEGFATPPPQKFTSESFVSPQAEEGIVAGINPVLELLHSGDRPIDTLFIDKDKGGGQIEQMVALARKKGIQIRIVPRAALDKMAFGIRHQGSVATVPPKEYADPYVLAEGALNKGKIPLLVILDGVEDPHNLGAIIRTAEGAGADGVVIPEHRAAHLTTTVSKVSSGALEHMPVAKVPNLANYLEFLKEKGFWTVGLAGDAKEVYSKPDLTVPLALVLGGEESGIRPVIRNSCDMLVSLPMLGKVSSLNVSVAAGVMLYEVIRQRALQAVK